MQIVDRGHQLGVAVLRVVVGIVFLWAGLEKAIGGPLGTWTADGFLKFATAGSMGWPFVTGEIAEGTIFNPTHDFWVGLAGSGFIDYLVPFGQMGIGIALIFGLLTRFGAAMGTLMMLFFFVAAWDFAYGIVNQHLTYAVVTVFIGYIGAGNYYGLDGMIGQSGFAQRNGWFRRWFLSGDTTAPLSA